jgi:hypothetical protein
LRDNRVILGKWVRRLTKWHGRQVPLDQWRSKVAPLLTAGLAQRGTPVVSFNESEHKITASVSLAALPMKAVVDSHGVALWNPPTRQVSPGSCVDCPARPTCHELSPARGTASLWRRLRLVDRAGVPTRRGRLVSAFSGGDGLAIAAALEDRGYHLDELVYDVACLNGGFRFAGDENRWAGRLALACHQAYGIQTFPGYLENGVPPDYGAGAEVIVAAVHRNPETKQVWTTEKLGIGDIDRAIIEWRSTLRQIAHAPKLDWDRWEGFQTLARKTLDETESPTTTDLPPLEYSQRKRIEHTLKLRHH